MVAVGRGDTERHLVAAQGSGTAQRDGSVLAIADGNAVLRAGEVPVERVRARHRSKVVFSNGTVVHAVHNDRINGVTVIGKEGKMHGIPIPN